MRQKLEKQYLLRFFAVIEKNKKIAVRKFRQNLPANSARGAKRADFAALAPYYGDSFVFYSALAHRL
jgi:hypothetical protein